MFVLPLTHVSRYLTSTQCEPETNRSTEGTPGSQTEILPLMEHVYCWGREEECVCACKIYERYVNIPIVYRYLLEKIAVPPWIGNGHREGNLWYKYYGKKMENKAK